MATAKDNLTIAAAHLARMAPTDWERFMGAFSSYSTEQTTNCVQSSLEELPRNQGRAQSAAHLHDILANCLQNAGKVAERKR